jgi:phosphoribosyl 1,2-cyclic phosphodiesterase
MKIQVLGSTSSGNATLMWDSHTRLLVDCGLPCRYTRSVLRGRGIDLADLDGALITHTHSDHVNATMVAALIKAGRPLYAPASICGRLKRSRDVFRMADDLGLMRIVPESESHIGGFRIQPFAVAHDSPGGCFGYRIGAGSGETACDCAIATDLGVWDDTAVSFFADADAVVLESNYDERMLDCSGRPAWLRRRIRRAHLSNDESAALLAAICKASRVQPRAAVLAHISQQANANAAAYACCRAVLERERLDTVAVYLTHMRVPSDIVDIRAPGDASHGSRLESLPLFSSPDAAV